MNEHRLANNAIINFHIYTRALLPLFKESFFYFSTLRSFVLKSTTASLIDTYYNNDFGVAFIFTPLTL
jgi:hypothetical protein